MSDFILELTSVPDRENLVAEIWFKNNLVAEVSQEKKELEVEIYLLQDSLRLPFNGFVCALKKAGEKLLEK